MARSCSRTLFPAAATATVQGALPSFQKLIVVSTTSGISPSTGTGTGIGSTRTYISRAHGKVKEYFAAPQAFQLVLEQMEERKKTKKMRWKRNRKQRVKKNLPDDGGAYRPGDETVDLALNLNLDPRKPGQSLRGSLSLPHGTGKRVNVAVFTSDEALQQKAKEMGALHVGDEDLMEKIANGEVSTDDFQRALATSEVVGPLSKKLARVLGPRGLMPSAKLGTVAPPDALLELLETQLAGKEVTYRTEKEGIIHVPVGKGSFGPERLLENVGAVMKTVYDVKPESYGKAKKKGKKNKTSADTYVISATVSSTFGKGFLVDLRTLDPSSAFFLKEVSI